MSLRLFNTLTQSKEPFEPRADGRTGVYVCGPTVYDLSHIGHARCYVAFDVLVRWLRHRRLDVRYVRNVTDVDDKIIQRANALHEDPIALAARFYREYAADMTALHCRPPDVEPRVSDHIPQIVALIERLVASDHAYAADGDVYFAVRSFPPYGKLSKRKLDDLQSGARVEVGEQKRDPLDFALWKGAKPGEPSWPSPWGTGRPGWHIECSAMSLEHLPGGIDIHGGGMDLVFPHHENEIAQSEAALGGTFARVWLHNGFVNVDKEKMSKSLGNFFTIRQVLERVEAEALRYFTLGTHYRGPIGFDVDLEESGALRGFPGLEEAERRVAYCYATLERVTERLAEPETVEAGHSGPLPEEIASFRERFEGAMDDDLNTAAALGHLSDLLRATNDLVDRRGKKHAAFVGKGLREARALLGEVSQVLGILDEDPALFRARRTARVLRARSLDAAEIERRVAERTAARAAKDFARADEIRQSLAKDGIEVSDSPSGTVWRVL
jgi:cysteinyl-tRNA synthetase